MNKLGEIFAELYLVDLDTLDRIIREAERIRAERRNAEPPACGDAQARPHKGY